MTDTAGSHQQESAKALGRALAEIATALRELELIHPVAANSEEFKRIQKLSKSLREEMMMVLQMKIR